MTRPVPAAPSGTIPEEVSFRSKVPVGNVFFLVTCLAVIGTYVGCDVHGRGDTDTGHIINLVILSVIPGTTILRLLFNQRPGYREVKADRWTLTVTRGRRTNIYRASEIICIVPVSGYHKTPGISIGYQKASFGYEFIPNYFGMRSEDVIRALNKALCRPDMAETDSPIPQPTLDAAGWL